MHQRLLGGRSIKKKLFAEFLLTGSGVRLLDIGCGPAPDRDLMGDVEWVGLELEEKYVRYVNKRLRPGDLIVQGGVDDLSSLHLGDFDVILLSGVLHHLSDTEAVGVLQDCLRVLAPHGSVITIDPVRTTSASSLETFLINSDRGKHIRKPEEYESLIPSEYGRTKNHVRHGLGWLPQATRVSILKK
jgi:2-polyprenyl-3-methyl-5-hydroxy-6-metoxy-1,4-benzoquinol methylase